MSHHFLCHKNVYHIMIEKLLLSYLNLYYTQKNNGAISSLFTRN
jgi:hypothetical protein